MSKSKLYPYILCLALLLPSPALAQLDYLVDDPFLDTNRIGGTDGSSTTSSAPTVSPATSTNTQWVSTRVSQMVASATGMLWTMDGNSRVALGYFPTVTVGAVPVTFTLQFRTGAFGASANNLRLALVDGTANGFRGTDGFSTGDATYVGDAGYAVFSSGSTVGGAAVSDLALNTFKRIVTSSNDLLGTAANWGGTLAGTVPNQTNTGPLASSAGATGYFEPNQNYTLALSLSYDGTALSFATTLTGGGDHAFSNLSYTATDASAPTTSFNVIAIRFGGGSGQFSSINFTRFAVTQPAAAATPAITSHPSPSSQTVNAGDPFSLGVVASGDAPLSYQWLKDATAITGATSSTFSIAAAQTTDAGAYTVVVTNTHGNATSNAVTLTVNAPAAPAITTQPQSQTATVGTDVTFTVVASGTAPLSYQWAKGGTAIAGATSSTLTLTNVQASDAANYSVTVTNAVNSVTSDAATLTVSAVVPQAPSIRTQPVAQNASIGGSVTFTVVASGTAPLSYQWAKGGTAISGATSSTLTLTNVQLSAAATYSVTITNNVGSVTSDSAALTVTNALPATAFNLSGFATVGAGTTGGGVIPETDAAYRKVTTPLEFVQAIIDSNKTAGTVKVIEIMNDLNLGWIEVGATVQSLASNALRAHATPKLHPTLVASGVSLLDIKSKNPLTIFSANGASIKHVNFNIKGTSNIIIRNLRFDELWEWDEVSRGDYDSNDWDFITLSNGGDVANIWIDHCTFTKAYDGAIDMKVGSKNVTVSWCRIVGDDGATNPNSFVRQQLDALEASKNAYTGYRFLRDTVGYTIDDIAQIIQGHDKGALMGATSLNAENATLTGTFHHIWFENVWDRVVPRLRGGNVHNFNLYIDDVGGLLARRLRDAKAAANLTSSQLNSFNNGSPYKMRPFLNGTISTEGGAILVEKSFYSDCLTPLRNNQTNPSNSTYTGKIMATDTIYRFNNIDGSVTEIRGNSTDPNNPLGPVQATVIPFSWNLPNNQLPYSVPSMDDPGDLPGILAIGAGAGVVTWSKDNWLRTTYVVDTTVPPSVTAQPQSITVAVGADTLFTVQAAGSAPLTYQWMKAGTNLVDGERITGATSAVLSITGADFADAGSYSVVVTNDNGNVTSNVALLTIVTPAAPAIATQPQSQTVNAGASAQFIVVPTGSPPFTYQWKRGGNDLVGATGSTLDIDSMQLADAGAYTVVVTNAAGSVTSEAATLIVRPPSFAGTYFGQFGSGGDWALLVRADHSGVFIGHLPQRLSAVVLNLTVDADGQFTAAGSESRALAITQRIAALRALQEPTTGTVRAAATADFTLTGRITAGQVAGQIEDFDETLSGSADASSGAAEAFAGFYRASALGITEGQIHTIIGPSGRAAVVTLTPALVGGGAGTVSADGQLGVTLAGAAQISVRVNSDSLTYAATMAPAGEAAPIHFAGLPETVPSTTRIVNLSVRGGAGRDDRTLILGFVVSGSGTQDVLVRGVGPGLVPQGVPESSVLTDPQLGFFSHATGLRIGHNDNWGGTPELRETFARLGAAPLSDGSNDAALQSTMLPGVYSAHVTTTAASSGIALIEVYDGSAGDAARFVNVSVRAEARTGDDILIAGFVMPGNSPKQLLIRAAGPSLVKQGVSASTVLLDPRLTLYRGPTAIAENDNWGGAAALNDVFRTVGAFTFDADATTEAALLVTIEPGIYTVHVSGVNNTTGVVLVEVYEVP